MTGSRDETTQEARGEAKVKGNLVPSIRQGVPPHVPRVRADPRDPPLADHDLERQLPLLLEGPDRSDPPPQPAMRAVTNRRNNAGITTKENANSEIPVPETIHDQEDRSLHRRRESSSKTGKWDQTPRLAYTTLPKRKASRSVPPMGEARRLPDRPTELQMSAPRK